MSMSRTRLQTAPTFDCGCRDARDYSVSTLLTAATVKLGSRKGKFVVFYSVIFHQNAYFSRNTCDDASSSSPRAPFSRNNQKVGVVTLLIRVRGQSVEVDRSQNAWHSRNAQSERCVKNVVTLLTAVIRNLAFGVFHFYTFLRQICPPETRILKICRVL